jgi:hypothetical protein
VLTGWASPQAVSHQPSFRSGGSVFLIVESSAGWCDHANVSGQEISRPPCHACALHASHAFRSEASRRTCHTVTGRWRKSARRLRASRRVHALASYDTGDIDRSTVRHEVEEHAASHDGERRPDRAGQLRAPRQKASLGEDARPRMKCAASPSAAAARGPSPTPISAPTSPKEGGTPDDVTRGTRSR